MASLYKKPVVTIAPRTGNKVKSKSKKWWGRFTDEHGREKRVPLATDKGAAQAMLNELVVRVERKSAGITDPFDEHLKKPLDQHVDNFELYLRHKGNTRKHVVEFSKKVRFVAKSCK